jgi:hypothetical protein
MEFYMKRKFLVLMLSLGVIGSAHAQFGGLLGGAKGGGGGGDVGALVDEFNRDSVLIREAVSYSLLQIVAALGDKEQIAAVRAKNDSLSKTTDAKEIGSIQGTVLKEQSVVAQQILDGKEAKAKMEKLSPEMQKKVAQSILAVGIAGLRVPKMLDNGKKAIEGVGSNPMMITKIVPVKDGVAIFADTLPKMTKIASTGFALLREVKIDPGTPTADTKLVADKNLSIPEE